MQSEALPPDLQTSGVEHVEMVRRVERRIRPATEKVCARTLDRETCRGQYRKITVHVKPEDHTINATADIEVNVTLYGGLVRRAGSDDEVAGVMGHEMAYVLLKHNEKAAAEHPPAVGIGDRRAQSRAPSPRARGRATPYNCMNARNDLLESGLQAGAVAGRIRYRPKTDLEADQFATYIVKTVHLPIGSVVVEATRKTTASKRLKRSGRRGRHGERAGHPNASRAHHSKRVFRFGMGVGIKHLPSGSDDSRQRGTVSLQTGGVMDQFQSYTRRSAGVMGV